MTLTQFTVAVVVPIVVYITILAVWILWGSTGKPVLPVPADLGKRPTVHWVD